MSSSAKTDADFVYLALDPILHQDFTVVDLELGRRVHSFVTSKLFDQITRIKTSWCEALRVFCKFILQLFCLRFLRS